MIISKLLVKNALKRSIRDSLKVTRGLSIYPRLNRSSSSPIDEIFIPNNNNNSDVFLAASEGSYVEMMYKSWQKDPDSVHLSWKLYFTNLSEGKIPEYQPPPNLIS